MTRTRRLESTVEDIRKLVFYPLPTKPTDIVKAIRVDRTHVFIDSEGRIYSTQVSENRTNYCYANRKYEATLTGLERLGVLSQAAVDQHVETVKADRLKSERQYAAKSLASHAEALGLALTDEQLAVIEEASK